MPRPVTVIAVNDNPDALEIVRAWAVDQGLVDVSAGPPGEATTASAVILKSEYPDIRSIDWVVELLRGRRDPIVLFLLDNATRANQDAGTTMLITLLRAGKDLDKAGIHVWLAALLSGDLPQQLDDVVAKWANTPERT